MKIIAIVGKTSTGKDSVVGYIRAAYGIKPIVSYTTREKRECEENGREHYFISEEEMDELLKDKSSLLAYSKSKLTNIQYCTSMKDIPEDSVFTYVINPNALEELLQAHPEIDVTSILLTLDERVILRRAIRRGDGVKTIQKRLESERDEFDSYAASNKYDFKIDTNKALPEVYSEVRAALYKSGFYTKTEMILEKYN